MLLEEELLIEDELLIEEEPPPEPGDEGDELPPPQAGNTATKMTTATAIASRNIVWRSGIEVLRNVVQQ